MATFDLEGKVTISVYTTVEADSFEEALEIAASREVETLEWGDLNQEERVWVSDDFDGEVYDIIED